MRIAVLIFSVFGCLALSAQYQFEISGTAPHTFNGKKIYLTVEDNYSSQKYKSRDSAVVQNSKFSFTGTINKYSEKATLQTKDKDIRGIFYFVVDSGLNTLQVKPLPPKWPLYKNNLSNTEIFNSPSNKIRSSFDSLTNYYYQTKGKASKTNKYLIELDAATNIQLRRQQLDVLKQHPDNFYTLVHLYSQIKTAGGFSINDASELYEALDEQLQSSVLGTEIREIIAAARSTEIGRTIPTFTIKTDKNDSFSNGALKGAVYLLAFGATWCGPCKERMPMLNNLYEKYWKDGFEIVYVNLDEKTQLWKQQIDKFAMSKWINVSEGLTWEDSQMAKRFNVRAIPYYLLVDKDGRIIYNPYQLNDFDYQKLDKAISSSTR